MKGAFNIKDNINLPLNYVCCNGTIFLDSEIRLMIRID